MTRLKEALREGIEACGEVLRGEKLPHQLDVWQIWRRVEEASRQITEIEEMRLYATLARMVVSVLRLQCRWLRYEADELFVDSDIARDTIEKMHLRSVITIFLKSLHPVVELEQLNARAFEMGMDHWDEITQFEPIGEMQPSEVETYGLGSRETSGFVGGPDFEELVSRIEEEYREKASRGEVEYADFVSKGGGAAFAETVERAFLTSFLISQGKLAVRERRGRLLLVKPTGSERQISESLAVVTRQARGR